MPMVGQYDTPILTFFILIQAFVQCYLIDTSKIRSARQQTYLFKSDDPFFHLFENSLYPFYQKMNSFGLV